MELYGIVGNVEIKQTRSDNPRPVLEVTFYSLDFQSPEGKNIAFKISFWEVEKYENIIKKGNRLRVFVDKVRVNPTINGKGEAVVYFNATGHSFTFVNSGNSNGDNNGNNSRNTNSSNNSGANNSNNTNNSNNNNNYNGQQQSVPQNNTQFQGQPTPQLEDENKKVEDIEDFLSSIDNM